MPVHASISTGSQMTTTALQSLTPVQAKLSIGAVNDPLEHEADAMADKVMRMPEPNLVQRKCTHCEEDERLQRKSFTPFIQRKTNANSTTTSDAVSSQIQATKSNGSPMPETTKSFMESRFGTNFSSVNIHTGSYASQLSNELNAQAFTIGNDIYFNEGKYQPDSDAGKHLLAHELTHTVQQSGMVNAIQKQESKNEDLVCKPPASNPFPGNTNTEQPALVCKVGDPSPAAEGEKTNQTITTPATQPAKTNFQRDPGCDFEAPSLPATPAPLPFTPDPAAKLPDSETAPDLSAIHSDKDWWDDKEAEAFGKLLAACYASRTASWKTPVDENAKLEFLKSDFSNVVQGWFGRTGFGGWFGLAGKLQGMLQKTRRAITSAETEANKKRAKDAKFSAGQVDAEIEKQMQQKRHDLVENVRLQVAVGTWGWKVERREKLDFETIGTTNNSPGANLAEVLTDAEMDTIIHNLLVRKQKTLTDTQVADVLKAAQAVKDANAKKRKVETSALTEEEQKKAITGGEFQVIKARGWNDELKADLAKARREKDEPNLVVPSIDEWQLDDDSNFIQRERMQLITIMASKKTDKEKFKQITTSLITWNRNINIAALKKKNEELYKALDAKKDNETEALSVMQKFIDDLQSYREEVKQSKEGNKIHKNVEAVLIELKKEFPQGFTAFNYVGHGGGAFLNRFRSADMYPKGGPSRVQKPFGEIGFFDQQTAFDFALAIDRAVGTTGGSYQILYNDFAVAREANKLLKHGKMFNVDNVTMAGKKDDQHVANLNWHGPLVTHFHVDFAV